MRDSASRYEKLLGYTRRRRFTVKQYCVEGYMGLISAPPRIRKVLRYGLVYKYTEDWTNRSVKVHCKSTKTFPILVCIFSCTHVHAPTVIKKYTLLTLWQKYFSSITFLFCKFSNYQAIPFPENSKQTEGKVDPNKRFRN